MEEKNSIPESDLLFPNRIHKNVISIDTHVDMDVANFTKDRNYTHDLPTQVTLSKMKEGGLDAVFFIVYTRQGPLTSQGYKKAYANADAKFKAIHRLTEEIAPDQIELATTAEEVRRIHKTGKLVALIGLENGYSIGEDLSRIAEFYNRGARYFSMTHNGHNQLGDSNTAEPNYGEEHGGLTELGKQVITELNRLGIIIDLSHPAQSSNKQALEWSKAAVIASHSSARALNDVSRNLWDDELKAIAKTGGVVQAVAVARFLKGQKYARRKAEERRLVNEYARKQGKQIIPWKELKNMDQDSVNAYLREFATRRTEAGEALTKELDSITPAVSVKDLVDHIDYMVDLIGIDHVGIASDFDGGGGIEGWNNASETFNVTLELVKRGYSEMEIQKLWGGNILRVMEEVEKKRKREIDG